MTEPMLFPVTYLRSPTDWSRHLPAHLRRIAHASLERTAGGHAQRLLGLESQLENYDILHAAEIFNGYTSQAITAKQRFGNKVVVTVWENIPFNKWLPSTNRSIRRRVLASADHFIAVTERAALALQLEGVDKNRITVIPVGVDLQRFRPRKKPENLLANLAIQDDAQVILFAGRIVRDKGVYELLYAVAGLVNHPMLSRPVKALLVGSGSQSTLLRQRACELGIDEHVRFVEFTDYNQIHQYYNAADLFALPSKLTNNWQEQFGMVLAEAMASGLPIVSTCSGSIPEVVGSAGILVQPGDVLSLQEAMLGILSDEERRYAMAHKSRRQAELQFDAKTIAWQINGIYEQVSVGRKVHRKMLNHGVAI